MKQAAKWCDQLVIYGLGEVHDSPQQTWGSASLLDRYGRITVAYRSLAKALNRTLPADPDMAPAPQGALLTPLPDLAPDKTLTPDTASGASLADPTPVEPDEPGTPPLDVPGPAVPTQDPTPAADEPAEAPSVPIASPLDIAP